eukprot:gb/GECG01010720.1/.p1 GENE.gb/GECG01010720.1/~~gb/GECG01010720.1/.p1  ORF type:complete len:206 (+),score=48.34 gb/GECG01010720.1/:1-618(+)
MSKRKKGMTLEEKRQTMMSIFHETKEPFNLKELEKWGGKRGVVTQTVKEVVQSLVDDNMVELEKIGTQNIFWSFPSKTYRQLQTRAEGMKTQLEEDRKAIEQLKKQVEEQRVGKEESEERSKLLKEYEELVAKEKELTQKIDVMKDNDPDVLNDLRNKVDQARQAANRWTDNVWQFKTYLTHKMAVAPDQVDQAMGLPDDFDYVE